MIEYKNETERLTAIAIIQEGMTRDFWKLITEALIDSKEYIQKQQDEAVMLEVPALEYKIRNEVYIAKKQFIDNLLETPTNLIQHLSVPESDSRNFDPYSE